MRSKRATAEADFSRPLVEDLIERLRPADVIGFSLMTNTFHRAGVLTKAIRAAGLKAPIVWGGPHATFAAEESLEMADVVCIGEGEYVMREYVAKLDAGEDPTTVDGLAFRQNGRIIRNPVAHLNDALDEYPLPDYDLQSHWVAMRDRFEPASPANLRGVLHRYRIETTRGCPYSCAFCNNAAMLRLYKGKGRWVRKRSNESIIRELEAVRSRFPTIEAVNIVDDLFFVRRAEEMEEFARLYEARVNLPIELDAFPNTISEEKVQSLSRLPISLISMGIQSGSPETLREVYKRPTPLKRIVEGINTLADHKLRAEYHYLINNPFESDCNRMETLRFAASYHRGPSILRIFPLQFYPGTPLYERARAEGVIGERHESAYQFTYSGKTRILDSGYLDIWLRVVLNLRGMGIPRSAAHGLISVVTNRPVRWAMDRKWFAPLAYGTYGVGRFIHRKLIYQPFIRPFRYLRRKPRYESHHPEDEAAPVRRQRKSRVPPPRETCASAGRHA
jgi:radical SAM superfamily enzyme YgiQ (UPF0313 family)